MTFTGYIKQLCKDHKLGMAKVVNDFYKTANWFTNKFYEKDNRELLKEQDYPRVASVLDRYYYINKIEEQTVKKNTSIDNKFQ